MLKTIIGILEKIIIMTWMLMWLNQRVVIINTTVQLLDIYRYRYEDHSRDLHVQGLEKDYTLRRVPILPWENLKLIYILVSKYAPS